MTSSFTGRVTAAVTLRPSRSQVVLVVALIAGVICAVIGFAFLWMNKEHSWVPFLFAGVLIFFAICGWFRARPATDLVDERDAVISSRGLTVRVPPAALTVPEVAAAIGEYFTSVAARQPLPDPDGMVNGAGKLIPGSQKRAQEQVDAANSLARESADRAIRALRGVDASSSLAGGSDGQRPKILTVKQPFDDAQAPKSDLVEGNLPEESSK